MTFFSDGNGGTPSHFGRAANLWYDIRDTYIVRVVVDGCRKNLPLYGLSFLRLPSISKLEWLVVFVIVAVLVLLLAQPTPHWRETSSQSCHLCGNCRVVIQKYRWWEFDSDTIEPVVGAQFSIPDGHVHEWWQYSSTFSSWSKNWAADNSARYKDGRLTWTP